jgi:hypothetical protein
MFVRVIPRLAGMAWKIMCCLISPLADKSSESNLGAYEPYMVRHSATVAPVLHVLTDFDGCTGHFFCQKHRLYQLQPSFGRGNLVHSVDQLFAGTSYFLVPAICFGSYGQMHSTAAHV